MNTTLFQYLLEFSKIAIATGIGFLIMGFIGFFVKLVHIPINNIIVGGMGAQGAQ
jgi:protein transport protein SEC61 subunit gamma and related proteins